LRNVLIAIGNSGEATLAPEAERLLDDASPLIRGAAIWALGRLARSRLVDCAITRRAVESDPEVAAEWTAALASAPAQRGRGTARSAVEGASE
jgi:epoxyqueuosine reductase